MKIAVLSDIHGNQDAFESVLKDMACNRVDKVICLGDCIGYGPESEKVIQNVRIQGMKTVAGNHELSALHTGERRHLNPLALESLMLSLRQLSSSSRAFISALPLSIVEEDCRFVHGFPPSSARIYLFQIPPEGLRKSFRKMKERFCFVGHTHELEMISCRDDEVHRSVPSKGRIPLDPDAKYIINVGSVGQPRDGDNRAKYVILDRNEMVLDVRFVPYDIRSVVEKMAAGGFPKVHARRLW